MKARDRIVSECRKLLLEKKESESYETAISFLRKRNLSKTQSIMVLMEAANISMAQSKEFVHFSKTWQDMREQDEKIINLAEKILVDNKSEEK